MKNLQKRQNAYPADTGENFIQEVISRHLEPIEPRRENNFLSNIFSKRVTNNFIRMRVYNNCTFYLNNDSEEDD